MSGNLQIAMWLRLHGGDAAAAGIRKFTQATTQGFNQASGAIKNAWRDLNGFSAASKLVAAAGGLTLLKGALDANLEFEKKILEMKQLADMTQAQASAMRQAAIDQSRDALATPLELAEGMRTLANAGMKYEAIAGTIQEAARAALAFRTSVTDIANMDFDIQEKFKIDPARMAQMHDMLYYHSKQGRFEAKSMSTYAPEYLNEMASLGMSGEQSLNFAGALTQQLQKIKAVNQPGEVATLIKHGLGHITSPQYLKHIKSATGIDVEKQFFNKAGQLNGEGGMDGLMGLAKALKAKGLDNVFKLQKAGFRDEYTAKFWLQLMRNIDEIEKQMALANGEAGKGTLSKDVDEMKGSHFGKIKALSIETEKAKLGDSATKGTDFAARMAEDMADHKGQYLGAAAGIVGAGLALRYNRNRKARLGAASGAGASALPGSGGGGVQQVFVTNWPTGMLAPGEALKQKRNNPPGSTLPGVPSGGEAPAQGKVGKALGAAGKGLSGLAAGATGFELGFNVIGPVVSEAINAMVSAARGRDETLGSWIYDLLHKESEPVKVAPIKVEVEVKNGNVTAQVQEVTRREARRN
jgi:TP901 family phage tail tape measure protein